MLSVARIRACQAYRLVRTIVCIMISHSISYMMHACCSAFPRIGTLITEVKLLGQLIILTYAIPLSTHACPKHEFPRNRLSCYWLKSFRERLSYQVIREVTPFWAPPLWVPVFSVPDKIWNSFIGLPF